MTVSCAAVFVLLAASLQAAAAQATQAAAPPPVSILNKVSAPPGGDLSLDNFEYNKGNTAGLVSVVTSFL